MNKRVLMVASVPSMIGQFNMENIRILLEMGYQVDVAADFSDVSVWPEERVKAFRDHLSQLGIESFQIDFSRHILKLRRHFESYRQIRNLIEERKYCFIHTHTPVASTIVRQASHKLGINVIYTAHGFHFYKGSSIINWVLFYPIEKYFSKYTDVLITINKEDYKRAVDNFNARETVYIPGVGVKTEQFSNCVIDKTAKRKELGVAINDFLLLSVGELSDRKNQVVVIEAFHILKKRDKLDNIVYLAVGKGDKEEELNKLIAKYDLQNHVKLLGFRTDIKELCKTVDCFVHPSIREGLGIAPLEAMAAGLPLISANVNGIKDYTEDGISGCCINPTNAEQMADAISLMHDDKHFREVCAKNNLATAKNFDISATNAVMTSVYQKMENLTL